MQHTASFNQSAKNLAEKLDCSVHDVVALAAGVAKSINAHNLTSYYLRVSPARQFQLVRPIIVAECEKLVTFAEQYKNNKEDRDHFIKQVADLFVYAQTNGKT